MADGGYIYFPGYISDDDEETQSFLTKSKSPPSRRYEQRRPYKSPEIFNGKSGWKDYWMHFQTIWDLNEWDEVEAAKQLSSSLRDGAVKVLLPKPHDCYGEERPLTVGELRERLDRRYGPGELAESFLAELKGRSRLPKETLPELAEAIRELVGQAYPEAPPAFLERLAVVHFKDALLDADIRVAVHRAKPNNLDEAVQAALEAESYLKVERQRERPRYARTTTDQDGAFEQRLHKIEDGQNALAEMFKTLMQRTQVMQTPPRPEPMRCYRCNQLGHIARWCPHQAQSMQPPRRPETQQCYRCGQFGHVQRYCQQTQTGNDSGSTQRSEGRPGNQQYAPQPPVDWNQQGFQQNQQPPQSIQQPGHQLSSQQQYQPNLPQPPYYHQ
jgi:hypothetical protein